MRAGFIPQDIQPIDDATYIGVYDAQGSGYFIVRKQAVGSGYTFGYRACSGVVDYAAAWQSLETQTYVRSIFVGSDLSSLLNPIIVTASSDDVQKTFVTNRAPFTPVVNYQGQPLLVALATSPDAAATYAGLTNAQLRASPILATVTFAGAQQITGTVGISGAVTVANPTAVTDVSLLAKEATVAATNTSLGTDGTAPPALAGTGVRGWLRGIYEKVAGTLAVSGTVTVANLPGTQAVSLAANTPDVTDRATRQLGVVTFSNTAVGINNLPAVQVVAATAWPLPTGAATEALQTAGNMLLTGLNAKLAAPLSMVPAAGAVGKSLVNAVSATPTLVKAGASVVYSLTVSNESLAAVFVSLYNKAAAPVAGDVPVHSLRVPAGATQQFAFGVGLTLSAGAALAITAANPVLGGLSGLLTANQVGVNIQYT